MKKTLFPPIDFGDEDDGFLQKVLAVTPSERQLRHAEMKYYNFIHFGMNTMTNVEWGNGKASPSLFVPDRLDTDQWCRVLKDSGSSGVILTVKHHDGFCLWDTKTTDYSVMNSPFGKDILRLLAKSCRKYDLALGVYLSPWDRHEKTYGTEEYNDFYVRQLTELAENYGKIFTFWLDGACGEGMNGKRQDYDYERYYEVIRRFQPEACISICGPDIRWIGNEGGFVRESEWSVVPKILMEPESVAEKSQKTDDGTEVERPRQTDMDIGSREVLKKYDQYCYSPAECDVSVNIGWFWHDQSYYPEKSVRTAEEIAQIYMKTVGGNATLLLNVPVDTHGRINNREISILKGFRTILNQKFAHPLLPISLEALNVRKNTRRALPVCEAVGALSAEESVLRLRFLKKEILGILQLEEDMRFSQRVEAFEIYSLENHSWNPVYEGTTIGMGKFCEIDCETDEILIHFTKSRREPHLLKIQIFGKAIPD